MDYQPKGETGGAVGGIRTFGCSLNFIIACANALCEFHTTAFNSTAITGATNFAFNLYVITTLVPIFDSIM
jgi:hypothetical protein